MLQHLLSQLRAWAWAHPVQALGYAYALLSVINGALPARYRGVGSVILDRLSALTRRDAHGTLKWPLVASVALRAVADSLDPPRPTVVPPALLALLAVGVAMALATLHGCNPSQSDPALPPIHVYVVGLDVAEHAHVDAELPRLGALGPAWVEVQDRSAADVVLEGYVSPDCATEAGRAVVGSRLALVDYVCATGDTAAESFTGHELLHAVGLVHVCAVGNTSPGCSPDVHLANVHLPALMSPSPLAEHDAPDGASAGSVAVVYPQREDLALWRAGSTPTPTASTSTTRRRDSPMRRATNASLTAPGGHRAPGVHP